jgi:hypothetical protein
MTRAVPQPDDYDDDGSGFLGVSYREDGDVPKLVIVGMVWAAGGIVALIAAVLAQNLALAVFGGLSTVAGGALWIALRARDNLQDGTYAPYTDPSAGFFDDDLDDVPEEDEHPTRVMSTGADPDGAEHGDDIEDAEYTEYTDYIERTPSEQDDGTGYDDDRTAQDRWEQSQRDREAAAAAEERSGRADGSDDDTEAVPVVGDDTTDSSAPEDEPSDAKTSDAKTSDTGTTETSGRKADDERDGSRG